MWTSKEGRGGDTFLQLKPKLLLIDEGKRACVGSQPVPGSLAQGLTPKGWPKESSGVGTHSCHGEGPEFGL